MIEQDIHVNANGNRLAGTLCLPSATGQFPVVLMAHGSGPLDRNQNMKGQALDVFNTIAHRLAKSGIASVRFDKRGCGASQGDYYTAGHHDFVADLVCWSDSLRRAEFAQSEEVFLLGHSEGCLVAAQASVLRPDIAGLALLCPFVESTEAILIRQAEQVEREVMGGTGAMRLVAALAARLFGGPVAHQRALIHKLRTSTNASIRFRFKRVPAKWLRELLNVDASGVFGNVACPMLLVGGGKDLQCDPADVGRIAALARVPVNAHVIANMTHVLRCDERSPTMLGVQRLLVQPVEAEVLDLVAEWVRSRVVM